MDFKDYYATLGVERTAQHDEIRRAFRKLARKFHPDVSKEPDAEARFKEVAEAHEALIDPERRAAYDALARRHANGQGFEPPPGWDSGFEPGRPPGPGQGGQGGADFSDFFETLFGRGSAAKAQAQARPGPVQGDDHHARVTIDLNDAYTGAQRTVALRMQGVDAQGQPALRTRQLEVTIPKGVRPGQRLRLQGQGGAGFGGAPAGDLYLEIAFAPHPVFNIDGRDLRFKLPVAPWEAALGATVQAPTPQGPVELRIPAGSSQGGQLRLKGKGLPGAPPGDLYAVLTITVPAAPTPQQETAWAALTRAYADYNPRAALEA